MADFFATHASEIWSALAGLVAGAAISIPITVRTTRRSMSGNSTRSDQSGARSGGDIVGRDKISH